MSEQITSATTPRTRWGAIIWGLVFAGTAGWALFVVIDPARRTAAVDALAQVSPFTVAMWAILAVGGLILLGGLVALVRRAQRVLTARRAESGSAVADAEDTSGNIEKPHDMLTEDVGRSE